MSVPSGDRGISSKQFYESGTNVVIKIAEVTMRQFGIHNDDNRLPQFNRDYLSKYEILAEESGKALRDMARAMMVHITKAYSITDTRIPLRRDLKGSHQTSAIGDCEAMIMELQLTPLILCLKPSVVESLIILIQYERDLLTKWRKDCNHK